MILKWMLITAGSVQGQCAWWHSCTAALQQKFVFLASLGWPLSPTQRVPWVCKVFLHSETKPENISNLFLLEVLREVGLRGWEDWFCSAGKDMGWLYCSLPVPGGSIEEYMRNTSGVGSWGYRLSSGWEPDTRGHVLLFYFLSFFFFFS